MKNIFRNSLLALLLLSSGVMSQQSGAQQIEAPQVEAPDAPPELPTPPAAPAFPIDGRSDSNEVVTIGGDSTLPAGQSAQQVVSVFGSSTADGEVSGDVVSILGTSRATGAVGGQVVAVGGDVYVNNKVNGQVVAVLGNIELGPNADVSGQVVAVGGTVTRDANAVVRGGVQKLSFGMTAGSFDWLHAWIKTCLLHGRPLALAPGLLWAWILAALALLSYVLTALFTPRPIARCVTTLEQHPGLSLLTAVLATIATPILFVLLFITLIGILVVPFLGIAVMCVGFFGRLVVLAWLGKWLIKPLSGERNVHVAWATLVGCLVVTALYLVPILGFIVYKVLGFIGYGVVLYALIEHFKQRNADKPQAGFANASGSGFTAASDNTAQHSFSTADSSNANANAEPASGDQTDTQFSSTAQVPPLTHADALLLPRASFWQRMLALLLDLIIVAIVLNMVYDTDNILLLTLAAYGAVMWKLKGTTVGGILFNIRIVRLDGRDVDWATAIVRALSCFLSLVVAGLGFIWILFDAERQAWHDKIAGTVVVRVPKGVSLV